MGRFARVESIARFPTVVSPPLSDGDTSQLATWLAERAGKLTASRMADAMSYLKNGQPSQKRKDLIVELLGERLTGITARHYVTPAMQWGIDHEAEAKQVFMEMTGLKIGDSGFYEHDLIENFGATPDGEIGNDAFVEIKCPTTETFVQWRLEKEVPEQHKPQMLAQLACGRRKKVHFFAYDPRIKDRKLGTFYRVFEPTGEQILNIEKAAATFLQELDDAFDKFVTAGA